MNRSRLHGLAGFQDGLSASLSLIDRVDEERDEDRLEEQQAADRRQQLSDMAAMRERQTLEFGQRQQDREFAIEDRDLRLQDDETQRERQTSADARAEEEAEYLKSMRPLARRREELYLSGMLQEQTVNEGLIKDAKREEREREASALVNEGRARAEAGDHKGAVETFKKLGDYGFDVGDMSSQEQRRITDTMTGLQNGTVEPSSEDAAWLAEKVLMPSMATSGRDPDKWELQGIVPNPGRGTFSAMLRNKETGESKPATMLGSSDPNDPPTEFTMADLMAGGEQLMALENDMMKSDLAAAGARLAIGASKDSLLDKARARELNARALKIEREVGAAGENGTYTSNQRKTFIKNYEATGVQVAAEMLTQEEGFNPESASTILAATEQVLSEPVEKGKVPPTQIDAMREAMRRMEATGQAATAAAKVISENAGLDLDEAKVVEIATKHKMNPMGAAAYDAEIKKLIKRAEELKARNEARRARSEETDRQRRERESEVGGPAGSLYGNGDRDVSSGPYGNVNRSPSSTPYQ